MKIFEQIESTGRVPREPLAEALAENEDFLMGRATLMARADRDRKEFLGAPWIRFDEGVRERMARQARRADFWRRFKKNALLIVAATAAGISLTLLACELLGWL